MPGKCKECKCLLTSDGNTGVLLRTIENRIRQISLQPHMTFLSLQSREQMSQARNLYLRTLMCSQLWWTAPCQAALEGG